ncbi:hypothetical protein PENSPDRAFT_311366 [Peniophora sp. CONT]|nr:hypothetical protein PENSPDRAFT_311366 [Peniophora sp. CONT]
MSLHESADLESPSDDEEVYVTINNIFITMTHRACSSRALLSLRKPSQDPRLQRHQPTHRVHRLHFQTSPFWEEQTMQHIVRRNNSQRRTRAGRPNASYPSRPAPPLQVAARKAARAKSISPMLPMHRLGSQKICPVGVDVDVVDEDEVEDEDEDEAARAGDEWWREASCAPGSNRPPRSLEASLRPPADENI